MSCPRLHSKQVTEPGFELRCGPWVPLLLQAFEDLWGAASWRRPWLSPFPCPPLAGHPFSVLTLPALPHLSMGDLQLSLSL